MANVLKMARVESIRTLFERGWSQRRIARELGIDRETVRKHLRPSSHAAKPAILPTGSAGDSATPSDGADQPVIEPLVETDPHAERSGPKNDRTISRITSADGSDRPWTRPESTLSLNKRNVSGTTRSSAAGGRQSDSEAWRQVILAKLQLGLSARRIHQDLVTEHGAQVGYDSVRRFLRRLDPIWSLPFRRLEVSPAEEAQIDFGSGAPIVTPDGKRRRVHVFRIVLAYSRKAYSEASYRQTLEDFIRCVENAFWYFGGVPRILTIDNLRAAVTHPDWFDPELSPKLQSFAQHYGCAILPTKPRTPRHKGKIERGVGYVKNNALKGHSFPSLDEENRHLWDWESRIADQRVHGTTKRQVAQLFDDERRALKPLPAERFAFFHEARRIVHRDGHVEVARAYYSVPPEYLARIVWVRWDARLVRIFNHRMETIAVHVRQELGRFSTQPNHIPAEKRSAVERGSDWLLEKVRRIGSEATRWAEAMLAARGIEGVRVLMGLLNLATRHRGQALDHACAIAHSYGAYRLRTLRQLLGKQAPRQEELPFLDEHPIIRPMSEYAVAFRRNASSEERPSTGFLRHGSGVRCTENNTAPDPLSDQGPTVTPSAYPRPGYPLPGCSPAEPDAVSPGNFNIAHDLPLSKESSHE